MTILMSRTDRDAYDQHHTDKKIRIVCVPLQESRDICVHASKTPSITARTVLALPWLNYNSQMAEMSDELIQKMPLFRHLENDDRRRLKKIARVIQFSRGDEIFREGSPSEHSYFVIEGRVKVFKVTPAGNNVILELFTDGDPFGAVAAYRGIPYPASAVALEGTTCLLVRQKEFFKLLEDHPTLVRGLLLGLTHRLVELTGRIANLTGGRVEPRFARLFLKLGNDVGKPGPDGRVVPLALSRQELADMTGTTVETCIRIMSRWSKDGIVRTEKGGFVLLNRKALDLLSFE